MAFLEKLKGALYGVAIGDAMGAPVEGWGPDRIRSKFPDHDFNTFIPPTHGDDPEKGKGAGRITDDTLMTEALILAYADASDHLDAYGYADHLLPHIIEQKIWIPERQHESELYYRLWHPEKYPWHRLAVANADPRTAGVGNCVNCGVAMWMMPPGAVNAGDPAAAYQEAAAIGSAHNESFAVEAGAVMAAAYAAAFAPDATIDTVLSTAAGLARDGTGHAIRATVDAVRPEADLPAFIAEVRAAIAPFDQREGHVADDKPLAPATGCDIGRPSREASIEELPVALAALKYGNGDFIKTIRAGVCYGRDCDSIAGMAVGLYGALFGIDAIPTGLRTGSDEANRRDFASLSDRFAQTIGVILEKDRRRFEQRGGTLQGR